MPTKQQKNPKLQFATLADVEAHVLGAMEVIARAFEKRLEDAGLGRKPKESAE